MCDVCSMEIELKKHCGMEEKEAHDWLLQTFGFANDVEMLNWLWDKNISLKHLQGPNIKAYLKIKAIQLGRCK